MQFFAPHRRSGFIDVAVIAIIVLVSAAVAVPVTYFANKSSTDNRGRAAICCGAGTCPDGWSYGSDCNVLQSCAARDQQACIGHQAKPAATAAPPAATTKPGTCTANGCTYYSCTQKLNTDSCGGRTGPVAGFCATNYPATDPCKINSTPSTAPPTSSTPPTPTTGACPNGQSKACGGCLVNVCVSIVTETCQSQINRLCNTNSTCAGNGVAPAAGQSCCSPYVLYSNGKCGTPTTASCIAVGGSKPVGGTTPCCTGSYDCGTSCADSAAKCPAQPPGTQTCNSPNLCTAPTDCTSATFGTVMSGLKCTATGQVCCYIQPVLSISAGVKCANSSGCNCASNGLRIDNGTTCPLASAGGTCTVDSNCTTGICSFGRCQTAATPVVTPSPLPIAAGKTCAFAYNCVCTDTGRTIQNTWTCPAQIAVNPGGSCPGGNSTCYCAVGGQTIVSGEKCLASTAIKAGQTCPSNSCTCPGATTYILEGATCNKAANGATCSNATECLSGFCTTVCSAKPVSCSIASLGMSIAAGASVCEVDGGPTLLSCTTTGTISRVACKLAEICQGSSCVPRPTPKPIAVGDICDSIYECRCWDGSSVIQGRTCPLKKDFTKCQSDSECLNGSCIGSFCQPKPTPLPITCTTSLCQSAAGCTCPTTCVSPGLKANGTQTPCGGILPVTTLPTFTCVSATDKGCSGNIAQRCTAALAAPVQTDCGTSRICDRSTGTCISPPAGTGPWTCNNSVATNAVRDSYTARFCDPEGQWKYEQGLSSGKACGGSASKPKNSDGSSCLTTFTCTLGSWQCGNDCADSTIQSTFNANYTDGRARWKYESGLNQGISCGGNASSPSVSSTNSCTILTGCILWRLL